MAGNSRFAVAVHILTTLGYLERRGVRRASSAQIAQSVNTNPVVIRSLAATLKKVGLIEVKEGKGGGIRLAKSPSRITLDAVYAALDGEGVLNENPNPEHKACVVSCHIKQALKPVLRQIDQAVHLALKKRTLQEIIDEIPRRS